MTKKEKMQVLQSILAKTQARFGGDQLNATKCLDFKSGIIFIDNNSKLRTITQDYKII